jgi:hypothetical protein
VGSVTSTCSAQRRDGYERRQPEQTLLYQVIAEHWSSFRERAQQAGGLPQFVVDEFEAYLRCGILEHGLAHLACRRCGHSIVVAYSCKRRGFCPSCLGRRMSDVAAHQVLPKVPVCQWVCSLPWRLRYAMGYDRRLCADVLAMFIAALRRSLRHRAKLALGSRSVNDAQIGAITFVQRGDSSLRPNVHFPTLALDGVYVRDDAGVLQFHALSTPTPEHVARVARWTYEGLARVCERHGRSLDQLDDADADADADELTHDQPALAACYGASVSDRQLLGDTPGQPTRKLVHPVCEVPAPGESLAEVGGVNVHAGPAIDGRDRRRLERLCRYVARPPVAQERLGLTADRQCLVYRFKHAWRDGAHAVVLDPLDLIARLVALFAGEATELEPGSAKPSIRHPSAWLLQRVFAVDVMACPRCQGAMKIVEIGQAPSMPTASEAWYAATTVDLLASPASSSSRVPAQTLFGEDED